MTTKYALNYPIDTNAYGNTFSVVWKLTRVMKAAGWTYKASGDGHIKDTTGTASNDRWGGNVDPMTDVYPSTYISNASAGLNANAGVIYVASTAGFPSSGTFFISSVNTTVTYTGTTATSFTGCTGGSGTLGFGYTGNIFQNGSSAYTVTLLDNYAAWWCAEGPSTVKIGITAASSGTFIRGEAVSQATSGATGELVGYVINAAANSGWMVILPRTGTFDGTHVITGGSSGATVTATAYNLIRRQVVIGKDTTLTAGWVFYEALSDTEIAGSSNTALFSDLAVNAANCTATVAPGNSSSSNNLFPSYGIAVVGTSQGAGQNVMQIAAGSQVSKAHIVAVNATPSAGVSADGSFYCALHQPNGTNTAPSNYHLLSFMRLDDTEPGDVDPFIFIAGTSEAATSSTGRTQGTVNGYSNPTFTPYYSSPTYAGTQAKGYCARTVQTIGTGIDVYSGFVFASTQAQNNLASGIPAQEVAAYNSTYNWYGSFVRIKNHPDAYSTVSRPIELFSVIGVASGITMRKGVCRWLGTTPLGMPNDTVDNKQWLVLISPTPNTFVGNGPSSTVVIGPWDGSSSPIIGL